MSTNKIVIFTNNDRSLNILSVLKKKFQISLIVLSRKNLNAEFHKKIKKLNINILYFEKNINKIHKTIKQIKPDFIICAGFPKLIPQKILSIASISSINLHGGRVPLYLGASTLNWQIINNEKYIYITALKMNSIIDAGPVIAEKRLKISDHDYFDKIKKKINILFSKLCIKAINNQKNKLKIKNVPLSKRIYWRQRKSADSKVVLKNSNSFYIFNLIRSSSLKNYPAYLIYKKNKYLLIKSKINNYKLIGEKNKIILKKSHIIINFKDNHLKITKFRKVKY